MTPYFPISDQQLIKYTLMNRTYLSETGCWVWKSAKDGKGYGLVTRNNKTMRAHRVSYEAFHGPIPKGLVVRHACDNPSCINPNHLSVGTQAENVADREARGRRDVKREQVGTAKLTEASVREIRNSTIPGVDLAKEYGVSPSTISLIRIGKSWAHVMETSNGR